MIGGLLMVNLLAAHAVRFQLKWKRAGIFLLHSGLIVLMLSEVIAGVMQVESRMTIEAGGSSNFIEDHRETELAVVAPADAKRTTSWLSLNGSCTGKERSTMTLCRST